MMRPQIRWSSTHWNWISIVMVSVLCLPGVATAAGPGAGYKQVAPGVYMNSPAGQEYALYPQAARLAGGSPLGPTGLSGSGITPVPRRTSTRRASQPSKPLVSRHHPESGLHPSAALALSATTRPTTEHISPTDSGWFSSLLLLLLIPPVVVLGLGLRRRSAPLPTGQRNRPVEG